MTVGGPEALNSISRYTCDREWRIFFCRSQKSEEMGDLRHQRTRNHRISFRYNGVTSAPSEKTCWLLLDRWHNNTNARIIVGEFQNGHRVPGVMPGRWSRARLDCKALDSMKSKKRIIEKSKVERISNCRVWENKSQWSICLARDPFLGSGMSLCNIMVRRIKITSEMIFYIGLRYHLAQLSFSSWHDFGWLHIIAFHKFTLALDKLTELTAMF